VFDVLLICCCNQTFVPSTTLNAHSAIHSLVQMVVVIHAFLFVQCFIFPNSYFDSFPAIICTNNRNNDKLHYW